MMRTLILSALLLVAFQTVAYAQKPEKMTKEQLQKMYLDYLKEEGYVPRLDEDGDVQFKSEGSTYFIQINVDDSEFFRIGFPNFWKIENVEERQKVLVAADHANRATKVAKVYVMKDNVWGSIELFLATPQDFKSVFRRSMSALKTVVDTFVKKMRE